MDADARPAAPATAPTVPPNAPLTAPPIARLITRLGLLLTGTLLALFAVLMVLHEVANRRADLQGQLRALAGMVAHNSQAAAMFGNRAEAAEILASLASAPDLAQAQLFLPDGQVLARWQREGASDGCHALQPAGSGLHTRWCGMVLYLPVVRHTDRLGLVAIEASLAGAYRALLGTLLFSCLAAALAFAAAVPLWRRLARRVAAPLDELVEVTRQVREHEDFSQRFRSDATAEVQALAAAFNGMLDQLQQRDERLNEELAQRRHAERRLNDLAYVDGVTGLHNRHHFMERIDQCLAQARRTGQAGALLFLDLDGFKQVNDNLGHEQGDELLRQVGQRLRNSLRSNDVICRLGGDEFAVILEQVGGLPQVESLAAKLLDELASPYTLGRQVGHVSASMGICLLPEPAGGQAPAGAAGQASGREADREALLRHADAAMYQAKQQGRNGFRVYRPASSESARHRRQALRGGLADAQQQGQLALAYQPQLDLASQRCFGLEALLRWQHPTLGAIRPMDFIALAESGGQIVPIGEWALQQACAQLARWRQRDPLLRVSVNLSPVQLADDAALDRLCRILADSGLAAGAVELELTENLLVDRSPVMLGRMGRLRAAGFGLAIDDFGIGYSSLAYLDSFPVTTLKIDRAFVRPLQDDAAHRSAIVQAIVAVGRALGTEVVAEGIETARQAERLLQLGCQRGQGYLYAEPQASDQADRWVLPAPAAVPPGSDAAALAPGRSASMA